MTGVEYISHKNGKSVACLNAMWIRIEHEQKEEIPADRVIVRFEKLTSVGRIPKSVQKAIAPSHFSIAQSLEQHDLLYLNLAGTSLHNPIERYWEEATQQLCAMNIPEVD
jgi:hypothetical protein